VWHLLRQYAHATVIAVFLILAAGLAVTILAAAISLEPREAPREARAEALEIRIPGPSGAAQTEKRSTSRGSVLAVPDPSPLAEIDVP
jgi:hypothetical protein